jgi:hypothetical protein
LDFDPQVVAFASQPFWLHWQDTSTGRARSHAPDFSPGWPAGEGWWLTVGRHRPVRRACPRRADRQPLQPDPHPPVPLRHRRGTSRLASARRDPRRRPAPARAPPRHPAAVGPLPPRTHRRHDRQPIPPRPRSRA